MLPFGAALVWTAFVLATIALPALLPVLGQIAPGSPWVTLRSYLGVLGRGAGMAAALAGLTVVFMAHQAMSMGDAIVRTGVRVFWTRRHLLQWVTAAQDAEGPLLSIAGYYRRMAGAPIIGALAAVAAIWSSPGVWLLAAPFALAWIASPAVAHWASQHSAAQPAPGGVGGRPQAPARDRTPDLAVLRDVRDAGGQHAAARQLPGRPGAGPRPPDLAHQYRPLPPLGRERA